MKNSSVELKYILIQALITLLVVLIPIYFYIEASIRNQEIKDKLDLQNYSSKILEKISSFSKQSSDIFYFPRSNIFFSTLFDDRKKEKFFTDVPSLFFESDFEKTKESLCYKRELLDNILQSKYLIVCKKSDYSEVIYNVLILLLIVTFFIFLLSFFVIKSSIEPYKRLNLYLDEFLKDAMHELKTPIGVARINIDMLAFRLKNDKHILRVKSALKNMTIIYEDLEYYMQQHEVKELKTNINLSLFLEKRVEFFNDLAVARNIVFHKNIEANIEIVFNEIEAYRIIDNNLSNAIKYSKNDSNIYVSLIKDDKNIRLVFKDEGVGIKDTSTVFKRYYRGDNITGGFGIGLSIVKNICDKNGIKIELDSKENQGSTFKYIFSL